MAKLLVVEDEPDIADLVSDKLTQLRHAVDVAATGTDAIAFIDAYTYDLIIMDLNIPPPNGFEVLAYVRSKSKNTKVVMLTTQGEIENKLRGFEIGADDYVCKPFDMRELVARILALLSRPTQFEETVVTWGNLTLNSSKFEISRGSESLSLRPKDIMLLDLLMRNPSETFSPETLMTRIWNADSNPSYDGLRVAVNRIRKAIDLPDSSSIIETVHRVGYKIGKPQD